MSPDRVLRTIAYVGRRIRPTCFILSGGEPTVRKDLPQIVDAVGHLEGLQTFHLHTNAVLIPRHAEVLSWKVAPVRSATVGIHGHTPELYDLISGTRGGFTRALRGIEALVSAGYEIRLACVVLPSNVDRLSEITAFLLGLGAAIVEIRLPIVGPGQRGSQVMVERGSLVRALTRWHERFDAEPRALLVAADAMCYGKSPAHLPGARLVYHFFDGGGTLRRHRRASSQLAAIWPEAYVDFEKSRVCGDCLLNAVCHGYAPAEVGSGQAFYAPLTVDRVVGDLGDRLRAPRGDPDRSLSMTT